MPPVALFMAATFENVTEAHQVALDVGRRVLERVADACLGGEIHHHTRPFGGEQRHKRLTLFQSNLLKTPGTGRSHGRDRREARLLEGGVVIAVEVVDADHAITALQQPLAERCPNETGSTGHQNRSGINGSHGRSANGGKQTDVMRISA